MRLQLAAASTGVVLRVDAVRHGMRLLQVRHLEGRDAVLQVAAGAHDPGALRAAQWLVRAFDSLMAHRDRDAMVVVPGEHEPARSVAECVRQINRSQTCEEIASWFDRATVALGAKAGVCWFEALGVSDAMEFELAVGDATGLVGGLWDINFGRSVRRAASRAVGVVARGFTLGPLVPELGVVMIPVAAGERTAFGAVALRSRVPGSLAGRHRATEMLARSLGIAVQDWFAQVLDDGLL